MHDIETIPFSDLTAAVSAMEERDSGLPPVSIAILRNITVEPVLPFAKYLFHSSGMRPVFHVSGYDTAMQEVMDDGSGLYRAEPSLIILWFGLDILAERLLTGFVTMTGDEAAQECRRVIGFIDSLLAEIRRRSQAMVLVHTFDVPAFSPYGVLDYQDRTRQIHLIRDLNRRLLDTVRGYGNAYVVDAELMAQRVGCKDYYDRRYWYIGKSPYAHAGWRAYAREHLTFYLAAAGKSKKCLVLDCDNTLWGGIVGEDGLNNIRLGPTYPGNTFRDFQLYVKELYDRGVMLAVCSKNNEADVLEVLEKHPDMVLKKEHFLCLKVNWNDKASNLREIAAELNIGTDSMVFVDDSEFEINLVRRILPEVTALLLPPDSANYRSVLAEAGLFDVLTFSEEDRNRNAMYRAEMGRKEKQGQFTDIQAYYRYLEMAIEIKPVDDFSLPRFSQLSLRTNQFNLTTVRYQEEDVRRLAEATDAGVWFLRLTDRFGDYGIVGGVVMRFTPEAGVIEGFFLSCRIIGRGVEDVLLRFCEKQAARRGCRELTGRYIPSAKNMMVAGFYPERRFTDGGEEDGARIFRFAPREKQPPAPDYFASITEQD